MVITPDEGGYWVDGEQHDTARNPSGFWEAPEIAHEHFHIEQDNIPFQYGRYLANKVTLFVLASEVVRYIIFLYSRNMTITIVCLISMAHFCCP